MRRNLRQAQLRISLVYDSVGKDTFLASLDCLKPLGLMVSFGRDGKRDGSVIGNMGKQKSRLT